MLPNVGLGELGLIFLVILMIAGPSRMPEIARALGKAYQTFNRETSKAREAFRDVFDEPTQELRKLAEDLRESKESLTKAVDDTRAIVKQAGVIDQPDKPVAAADPHAAPIPEPIQEPIQEPIEPPESVPDHPTNTVIRDYEDT